jgi:hypothetical protein
MIKVAGQHGRPGHRLRVQAFGGAGMTGDYRLAYPVSRAAGVGNVASLARRLR